MGVGRGRQGAAVLGAILLATALGCVESKTTVCADGTVCPIGTVCGQDGTCVSGAECGNGVLEPDLGETCDDGNRLNFDPLTGLPDECPAD